MGNQGSGGQRHFPGEISREIAGRVGPRAAEIDRSSRQISRQSQSRKARQRARDAGHMGLYPGASPESMEETYMWGAQHHAPVERALRGNFTQPTEQTTVRTRSGIRHHRPQDRAAARQLIVSRFRDDSAWTKDICQKSRDPRDVAAYHQAWKDGRLRRRLAHVPTTTRNHVFNNPSLIRGYVQHASDKDLKELFLDILQLQSIFVIPRHESAQLARRSLAALLWTPDNPRGMHADRMFDLTLNVGTLDMIRMVIGHLSPGYLKEHRSDANRILVSRAFLMDEGTTNPEIAGLFPPGYVEPSVEPEQITDDFV
jgi:hypothetical protein